MNHSLFLAYLLLAAVLMATPGPVVTLVIATGASRGVRAALMTVAGSTLGNAVLIGAVALGLSVVLAGSALLFDVLRVAGAAYLVWLGVGMWRAAGRGPAAGDAPPPRGRAHAARGFLVALSNPKTASFFSAFLPQFVDPALPAEFQLAALWAAAVALAALFDSCWGVAAGLGRAWFAAPARAKLLGRFSAVALVVGGVWLALVRRPA